MKEIVQLFGESVARFTIPIFIENDKRGPEQIGTGFFLNVLGELFFTTASHVVDVLIGAEKQPCIALGEQVVYLNYESIKRTKNRTTNEADDIDIAVFKISSGVDMFLEALPYTIPLEKVAINLELQDIDLQLVQGFPSSKNKGKPSNAAKRHVRGVIWSYLFSFSENTDFGEFGKQQEAHYAIKWSDKINGDAIPHPRGVSGGPYWVMPDSTKPYNCYLAGVFIEYYKHKKVAFATKIEKVLQLIRL
ncbi:Peptidase S1 domain-containing protein [Vibrio crassostreae]|nr:Peptidase S1 domain-containing protein [Vibrio crassostreae]